MFRSEKRIRVAATNELMLKLNPTDAMVLATLFRVECVQSLNSRNDCNTADSENGTQTVSVSVETVIEIVFVDTVVELVTCGAITLINTVRESVVGMQKW